MMMPNCYFDYYYDDFVDNVDDNWRIFRFCWASVENEGPNLSCSQSKIGQIGWLAFFPHEEFRIGKKKNRKNQKRVEKRFREARRSWNKPHPIDEPDFMIF